MAEPIDVSALDIREPIPGFRGRFIHSEHTTHVYWDIGADSALPEHDHPHEQIVNMLEGTFVLVLDGVEHVLDAGDVLVIPGGATHSGHARTVCRILDVFSPVREDYR